MSDRSVRWLAVLDTMWDWEARTSRAGYEEAPQFFCINPRNFTGRRLYKLTGEEPGSLWCTNVCPELVRHPDHHGTPSAARLRVALHRWGKLIALKAVRGRPWEPGYLVCGRVAQGVWDELRAAERPAGRVVYLPHPAARTWQAAGLQRAGWFIREGRASLVMRLRRGALGGLAVGQYKDIPSRSTSCRV